MEPRIQAQRAKVGSCDWQPTSTEHVYWGQKTTANIAIERTTRFEQPDERCCGQGPHADCKDLQRASFARGLEWFSMQPRGHALGGISCVGGHSAVRVGSAMLCYY